MSQRIRASAKWRHTHGALALANQAVGGRPAKQFLIADSEDPAQVERSFSPGASAKDRAQARKLLEYLFVGDGFDLTVDRGDAYYEGPREVLADDEKRRRRKALADLHETLGIAE